MASSQKTSTTTETKNKAAIKNGGNRASQDQAPSSHEPIAPETQTKPEEMVLSKTLPKEAFTQTTDQEPTTAPAAQAMETESR